MPTVWRIFKPKYAPAAFTGEGARLYGGRWNNPGTPVVYTAGSASLAALEMLVHLSAQQVLSAYQICEATFDDAIVLALKAADLLEDWRSDPAPFELKQLGDAWIANRDSAVLRVPSAIIDTEQNYLLNPAHDDFAEIQFGAPRDFLFDERLAK